MVCLNIFTYPKPMVSRSSCPVLSNSILGLLCALLDDAPRRVDQQTERVLGKCVYYGRSGQGNTSPGRKGEENKSQNKPKLRLRMYIYIKFISSKFEKSIRPMHYIFFGEAFSNLELSKLSHNCVLRVVAERCSTCQASLGKYIDKSGKARFVGDKQALKQTQTLVKCFVMFFAQFWTVVAVHCRLIHMNMNIRIRQSISNPKLMWTQGLPGCSWR